MKPTDIFSSEEGGYVFISHSHLDIKKVRKIRDELERAGFEPLCFYLRCLTDDDEVEGLIKREIDAREWFVYLDSANARNSKWVQKELAYIKKDGAKKVSIYNLDEYENVTEISNKIMDSMRVFLSYSHYDENIVSVFRERLIERDLKVIWDIGMPVGVDWREWTVNELELASKHGCVLLFVSKRSINQHYLISELDLAVKMNALIVPVFIDISYEELSIEYKFLLNNISGIFIDGELEDKDINIVIKNVERLLMGKFER